MTVAEYIAKLKAMPQDAVVVRTQTVMSCDETVEADGPERVTVDVTPGTLPDYYTVWSPEKRPGPPDGWSRVDAVDLT